MAPTLCSTSTHADNFADRVVAQLALLTQQFAQAEERHRVQLREERKEYLQEFEAERQRRLDDTGRQYCAIDDLHNTVHELQRLQYLDSPLPSRAPTPSRVSARARLGPLPHLKVPPVHLGAKGSPFTIPPTGSIHLGIYPMEDSLDSTLRSNRCLKRHPSRECLRDLSAEHMPNTQPHHPQPIDPPLSCLLYTAGTRLPNPPCHPHQCEPNTKLLESVKQPPLPQTPRHRVMVSSVDEVQINVNDVIESERQSQPVESSRLTNQSQKGKVTSVVWNHFTKVNDSKPPKNCSREEYHRYHQRKILVECPVLWKS
ncbi:hypothetical protein GIB67_012316 [Kingdonia uniflora]|uniref:Uncharacterized protein n=1 Tax=Kingdonia uniflora TaxID=39325 RepID=A0A7J7MVE0_9MAGN|nr:hypothetical protein GIB67_012316 [Kingdonia uniflora]